MDQHSTSAIPSEAPGEKEGEKLVVEETIAEPGGIEKISASKESSANEINHSTCRTETQSDTVVAQTETIEDSKTDNALDVQQSSNILNVCKESEVTVSPAIKDESEKAQNIIKEDNSSLENKKEQESIERLTGEKDVISVTEEVPKETHVSNGTSKEIPEVSKLKNAVLSCDEKKTEEIDAKCEAEAPKELSSSVDSVDVGIKLENISKSEEENGKEEPNVAAAEAKITKEAITEEPKDEVEGTSESPTETIEFSLIEYSEESIEETTVSNTSLVEVIVQSKEDDSTSPALVTMENLPSSDKDLSQNDESIEIIDKNESCLLNDKKEVEDLIVKPAEEKECCNKAEMRESEESMDPETSSVNDTTDADPMVSNNDSNDSEKPTTSEASSATQRSVIQDIFDDWRDENPEDEGQQASKSHDSVEMELKILLDDDKPTERTYGENVKKITTEQISATEMETKRNLSSSEVKTTIAGAQIESMECKESEKQRESVHIKETTTGPASSRKSNESTTAKDRTIRSKPLAPRPGVKVPGFLLSSPIVSKTAVSKVLKERLREQQKEFDAPVKPDIFFVKKITQRLSHKLAAASAAQIPGLVPLSQSTAKMETSKVTKSPAMSDEKKTSSIDKELLAILEGDVDPDWSNLRSPNIVDETKNGPPPAAERNTPPKLDPLVERELALKQLLELPSSPGKKTAVKKIPVKTPKNKNPKVTKTATPRCAVKKETSAEPVKAKSEESTTAPTEKHDLWDNVKPTMQELKADETRSGRKRKPTEKAREHEQNSTKRLFKAKVLKGKGSSGKRSGNESDQSQTSDVTPASANDSISQVSTEITEEKPADTPAVLETASEKRLTASADVPPKTAEVSRVVESTREIVKKKVIATSNAKRKIPIGQKFVRQKMPANKKQTLGLKSKFPKGISKKTATKIINTKGQKQRNRENSTGEAKPKKKSNNEIDRLLQDEGVVNLLYDVEQTGKKRLVPITKSQTKVMDLQKIQRELKIRTKLVRNAVLRLRTSNISTSKVSPRSKRSTSYNNDATLSDKKSVTAESIKSGQSGVTPSTDFIYPAKIRNAADASIIIRRHSSSSFSSASASPRASIDGPDRLYFDGSKNEEGSHVLRSNKRLHSREEEGKSRNNKKKKPQQLSPEPKRNRRKTVEGPETHMKSIDIEAVIAAATGAKNKASASSLSDDFSIANTPRGAKKVEAKKNAKSLKQQLDVADLDETGGAKTATRSNGAGGGKIMPKSKKSIKGKVTFAKGSESFNKNEATEREDELSACLAEVVTALANDSGGPSRCRSTVPVNRYRTKGIASSVKSSETDGSKPKLESRVQFSNKEINVQRHGNLVQLLLTPSKTTKIRNGITLQVMQEIRENLSILKKDEECRVVLLTSTGTSFCEGLELSTILHENKEERRIRAQELANGVKEFIKSLATFNKPIVAGVQGSAIGLGVTMLPWFDLVIASDKATFSTPYGKLGQIAEGAAIFTLSHILGSAVTSELLLGGRTLTASEALRAGLVTRVLWPDRFQAELLPSLRAMSEQSSQSMEATKALLRHSLRKKLDAALESESYLLVQHWCSAECQAAITAYVDEHIQ